MASSYTDTAPASLATGGGTVQEERRQDTFPETLPELPYATPEIQAARERYLQAYQDHLRALADKPPRGLARALRVSVWAALLVLAFVAWQRFIGEPSIGWAALKGWYWLIPALYFANVYAPFASEQPMASGPMGGLLFLALGMNILAPIGAMPHLEDLFALVGRSTGLPVDGSDWLHRLIASVLLVVLLRYVPYPRWYRRWLERAGRTRKALEEAWEAYAEARVPDDAALPLSERERALLLDVARKRLDFTLPPRGRRRAVALQRIRSRFVTEALVQIVGRAPGWQAADFPAEALAAAERRLPRTGRTAALLDPTEWESLTVLLAAFPWIAVPQEERAYRRFLRQFQRQHLLAFEAHVAGYRSGFDVGYDTGYDKGYDEGFASGVLAGGGASTEDLIPWPTSADYPGALDDGWSSGFAAGVAAGSHSC